MRKISLLVIILGCVFLWSCGGLFYSAKTDNVEGIKKSLAKGTPIDKTDEQGRTALMIAAYSGNAAAVEYLCQKGANVNLQDRYSKCTALLYASYYNFVDVAEILLRHGADQTITDKYGHTPVYYAEEFLYGHMIQLFNGQYAQD
jgi:ankyrin repeat protein